MSKLRKVADVERTATMLDLVHRMFMDGTYGEGRLPPRYVLVEEVAPGTGFSAAQRWADLLALSMWPSDGLTLQGFEIKASRADLKRELADLAKHQAVARYCDRWTLVVWDESVLVDEVPVDWGLIWTKDGDDGRELVHGRAAVKRTPEPWPKSFTCSLVRNAFQQSPSAAYVARACREATRLGHTEGRNHADAEFRTLVRPLFEAVYGKELWNWPRGTNAVETMVKDAAARLAQGSLLADVTKA
jgi:hypothetical protein